MAETTTKLDVNSRTAGGSREVRRLRRSGRVPGVLYGGGGDAVSFDADARELRLALARSGAVLDLSVDGGKATPVVLKETQRDPCAARPCTSICCGCASTRRSARSCRSS